MAHYQVVVGNIGTTLTTSNKREAIVEFGYYAVAVLEPFGRCSGEDVTLLEDGEVIASTD